MDGRLNKTLKIIVVILTLTGIFLSINKLFYLNLFGINPMQNSYLYLLLACFTSIAFLLFPASKKKPTPVKWFDLVFFVLSIGTLMYFSFNGERIILEGWQWNAPPLAVFFSVILWILLLESLRRTGGLILSIMCLVISLYPLIASNMPVRFLQGKSYDFFTLASNHVMSNNSIIGIPFTTVGNLIIGFLVFGVVLTYTGGGGFFFKLAQSLFGKTRGGEAKVSVVASAFFGMLSGSAISNTITSGAMTIPAMKKSGYKAHYAGAVEACASTGGTITPPIMGSAAFIMASFLGVPYLEIILAAAIPSFLYYLALLVQVDGYAARKGLKGMPKSTIPSFIGTIKEGWYYLIALLLLIGCITILNSEGQAPYYASAALLVIAMIKKQTRMNLKQMFDMVVNMSKVLTEVVCIIAGVGFIVGALSATGVSFSFSRELVAMAGDNVLLILMAGAITSFILGMGMTVSAVYVFLAIVMAPALVEVGINPIAAHLFVVYWATASYITPPVALAAFSAASIAKSSAMKTGFTAMRLGIVTFLIPFFFVYQPELIAQGNVTQIVIVVATSIIGVGLLASALEGYLTGVGRIDNILFRILLFALGVCLFIPNLTTDIIGLITVFFVYIGSFILSKRDSGQAVNKREEYKVMDN
ncbi:TRAP transporter permease [Halobacillus shinanisalinarum]|uniref:TRAP transporter permease n=1 Tax=Halobacillus shinanisalinarum TaxID=2932258 RepID=A0ABY4H4V3_9BACI|nr:TRAP transporter permease [Halobacillus shinanisalinarum]UOQ95130.1 TRAP transporter permease [Halobacillus shinanisalinarum]